MSLISILNSPFYFPRPNYSLSDLHTQNVVERTKTHTTFAYEFPGLKKEDLVIELANDKLYISGKTEFKTPSMSKTVSYSECMSVPRGLTENDVEVSYDNGLLYVKLPNKKQTQENRLRINLV